MRKEVEITIEQGRDKGKTFKITEMGAVQMDSWAIKALCLLGKSGVTLEQLGSLDMNAIFQLLGNLGYEWSKPLMDELLECASFKKDGAYVPMKGSMIDSVVEDVSTLFRLKMEALTLNLGFLDLGDESKSK